MMALNIHFLYYIIGKRMKPSNIYQSNVTTIHIYTQEDIRVLKLSVELSHQLF